MVLKSPCVGSKGGRIPNVLTNTTGCRQETKSRDQGTAVCLFMNLGKKKMMMNVICSFETSGIILSHPRRPKCSVFEKSVCMYAYVYTAAYHSFACTGHTQKNGAVSKVNKNFMSHITRAQHTPSAAATVQVSHALPAVRFSCFLSMKFVIG
jgi:hypothetical protein